MSTKKIICIQFKDAAGTIERRLYLWCSCRPHAQWDHSQFSLGLTGTLAYHVMLSKWNDKSCQVTNNRFSELNVLVANPECTTTSFESLTFEVQCVMYWVHYTKMILKSNFGKSLSILWSIWYQMKKRIKTIFCPDAAWSFQHWACSQVKCWLSFSFSSFCIILVSLMYILLTFK